MYKSHVVPMMVSVMMVSVMTLGHFVFGYHQKLTAKLNTELPV